MTADASRNGPWSVVLAGGNGDRLRPVTERWLGRHLPKQYCAFSGGQTMLEDALDRAEKLSGPSRILTVVAREHLAFSEAVFDSDRRGHRVIQPRNCGTVAGIFLPLTYIRKAQPDATVVILPSDHFLRPEDEFIEVVRAAVRAARELRDQIVLVGAIPDTPEPDYGWIVRGRQQVAAGPPLHAVEEFIEKPHEELAKQLMAAGALWNTFVMAAPLEELWGLGWKHVPDVMARFETLERAIATPSECETLDAIYEGMPDRNFSSEILQNARGHVCVMELEGVAWTDLGRPERLERTLLGLGIPDALERALTRRGSAFAEGVAS
jgi:mannose-1-phosphate guanylyltransferase